MSENSSPTLRYWVSTYTLGLLSSLFFCFFILDVPEGQEILYAILLNSIAYYVFVYRGKK
jgi:hypothetical protein